MCGLGPHIVFGLDPTTKGPSLLAVKPLTTDSSDPGGGPFT